MVAKYQKKESNNILEDKHINFLQIIKQYEIITQFVSKRILVIDDEEFCISSMKAILHQFKFDVNYQVDYCLSG